MTFLKICLAVILAAWYYRYHSVSVHYFYSTETYYELARTSSEAYRLRDERLNKIKDGSIPLWTRSAVIAHKNALDLCTAAGRFLEKQLNIPRRKSQPLLIGRLTIIAGLTAVWLILRYTVGSECRKIVGVFTCLIYFVSADLFVSDILSLPTPSLLSVILHSFFALGFGAFCYFLILNRNSK